MTIMMDTGSSGIDMASDNGVIRGSVTSVITGAIAVRRVTSPIAIAVGRVAVTGAIAVRRVAVAAITIAISRIAITAITVAISRITVTVG